MINHRLHYLLFSALLFASATAVAEDDVWFWYLKCGDTAMNLEVKFDHATLYREKIPLCRAPRASVATEVQQQRIVFSFKPSRRIIWSGYRDGFDITAPKVLLEGNLWQAGADPADLLIGVTFDDVNGIHMNALHIAYPNKRTQSAIAPGLAIVTSPAHRTDPAACPASMSPAVEKKLLSVLDASTESVLDEKTYDTAFDQLLDGKDDASVEARVALMDYPIGAAYSELLSCVVSTGGKKSLYYLDLYSRCDIAPTRSRVRRDHANALRSITIEEWKAGHGKGSCDYE